MIIANSSARSDGKRRRTETTGKEGGYRERGGRERERGNDKVITLARDE